MNTSSVTSATVTNPLDSYVTAQNAAISSATAASSTSSTGIAGSETTFLKILTTQLTNQDPTAATDPNQFTEELVQFTQAEQQVDTNAKLDTLISLQQTSSGVTASLSYIGKYVEAPANGTLPLQNGTAELSYTVPSGVANMNINILDSSGNIIKTLSGATTAGTAYTTWDGTSNDGTQEPDGAYTYQMAATDGNGNAVTVSTVATIGLVTGVTSNSDGTTSLSLGQGAAVDTTDVLAAYTSLSQLPTATSSTSQTGS